MIGLCCLYYPLCLNGSRICRVVGAFTDSQGENYACGLLILACHCTVCRAARMKYFLICHGQIACSRCIKRGGEKSATLPDGTPASFCSAACALSRGAWCNDWKTGGIVDCKHSGCDWTFNSERALAVHTSRLHYTLEQWHTRED